MLFTDAIYNKKKSNAISCTCTLYRTITTIIITTTFSTVFTTEDDLTVEDVLVIQEKI